MSISVELSRLQTNRNTIRTKLVELGMANSTDKLDVLAAALENLINRGAVNVEVKEGETYTIPAGYHNGSGVVSGVSGGGNYTLQTKTVTPTKKQQSVAPDSGYYGLSAVTVGAIPDTYQDVSSVNTAAGDVLTGKIYVTSDGTVTTGTMVNNGAKTATLDAGGSYTIPAGYHNGSGKITAKTLASQTAATAAAAEILSGETAWVGGTKVTGTMANNGATGGSIDGLTTNSVTIPAGYTTGGTVSLTGDIEEALAAI